MKNFTYLLADNHADAAAALAGLDNAVAKGGGTDLLDLMKERVLQPDHVVSLGKGSPAPRAIQADATLAEVARMEWVPDAVRHAAAEAATPQIRNVGTIGGNLCQHTRCWYFRSRDFECWKRGDSACAALAEGAHNRYHACFGAGNCVSAHPSNLAPALIAVGARVKCVHPDGDRELDVELLYDQPRKGVLGDTILRKGEVIESVLLPKLPRRSVYVEFREKLSFDFAVCSVAAAGRIEGGVVKDLRIVCGAVAPTPFRAVAAEALLRGKKMDAGAAAATVVKDARPLAQNKYKVVILERLVRQALEELTS